MAESDDKKQNPLGEDLESPLEGAAVERREDDAEIEDGVDEVAAGELGSERFVFAAFFAAGALLAFLIGRIGAAIWNSLAETPSVVREFPQLLRLSEEERPTFTMLFGVVVAVFLVVSNTRKESVRNWADGVASELGKVHWPEKDTVTNGTVVVIAAGVFATLYIGLLDRLWGFVTMLVYGT